MKYTQQCSEDCQLTVEPVPGAKHWPKRVVCRVHGYPNEPRSGFSAAKQAEVEKPNHYIQEIASPADVIEIAGNEISLY